MRFKVRPGFIFMRRLDSTDGNLEVRADEVFWPSAAELSDLTREGKLGILEPLDAEAVKYFGSTDPLIAKHIPRPAPPRQFEERREEASSIPFGRGETIRFEDLAELRRTL